VALCGRSSATFSLSSYVLFSAGVIVCRCRGRHGWSRPQVPGTPTPPSTASISDPCRTHGRLPAVATNEHATFLKPSFRFMQQRFAFFAIHIAIADSDPLPAHRSLVAMVQLHQTNGLELSWTLRKVFLFLLSYPTPRISHSIHINLPHCRPRHLRDASDPRRHHNRHISSDRPRVGRIQYPHPAHKPPPLQLVTHLTHYLRLAPDIFPPPHSNWPIRVGNGKTELCQAFVLGLGNMFNHSFQRQNVGWKRDLDAQVVVYTALKDIEAGQELLISYGPHLTFVDIEKQEEQEEEEEDPLGRIALDL